MQPSGGTPYAQPGGPYPAPPMVTGWAMPAPPQPRPRGTPNRSLFLTGAVGHFIAAGMAIPFSLFALYLAFAFGFGFGFFSIIALTSAIMMGVALVFLHIGFYGFWRNYGSTMGGSSAGGRTGRTRTSYEGTSKGSWGRTATAYSGGNA